MPKRVVAIVLLLAAAAVDSSPAFGAAPGECAAGTEWNELLGVCLPPPRDPDDPTPPQPQCQWRRALFSELRNPTGVDPNLQFGDGWFYSGSPSGAVRRNGEGKVQTGYRAYACDDGAPYPNGFIQWRNDVTVDDLIPLVPLEARRQIPFPAIFVNPPAPLGIVNLGMWLAVTNSETITLPVGDEANGPWIRITATLTETEWDMGNGDTVDCTGPAETVQEGDPGWDSPDEGPCGYTYTQHTPGDDTYTITVTATWSVSWVTSDGRTGTIDPIVLSNSLAYDVDEIQTVGASG